MKPSIRQIAQKINELEKAVLPSQDDINQQHLEWTKLVNYQVWLNTLEPTDNPAAIHNSLPKEQRLENLKNLPGAWWSVDFAKCFNSINIRFKQDKIPMLFWEVIKTGLEQTSPEELKTRSSMNTCIEYVYWHLKNDNWSQYDLSMDDEIAEKERQAEKQKQEYLDFVAARQKPKKDNSMLKLSPKMQQHFDELEKKYHPKPQPVKPNEPQSNVRIKYVGKQAGGSTLLQTVNGLQKVFREKTYIVTNSIFENVKDSHEWERTG